MTKKRKEDVREATHFRSDRIVRENDTWFFLTREGTMEGPYGSEADAYKHLDTYVKLMKTRALEGTEKFTLIPMAPSTID